MLYCQAVRRQSALSQREAIRFGSVVFGALAQLGERLHGMQEVVSSILIGSISYLISPMLASVRVLLVALVVSAITSLAKLRMFICYFRCKKSKNDYFY